MAFLIAILLCDWLTGSTYEPPRTVESDCVRCVGRTALG